jgi:peptidoglycan-N-acetylglucosamine deacetylase
VFHEFLERIVARGDVWFAPLEEITAFTGPEIDAGRRKAMVEPIPQYAEPVGKMRRRR